MNDSVTTTAPKRRRWGTLLAIIVACGCILGAIYLSVPLVVSMSAPQTTHPTVFKSATSVPSVRPAEVVTPSPSPTEAVQPLPLQAAIPPAAEPRRLQIPSAGIDITVAELPDNSVSGTALIPPEDPAFAYWVSQFNFGLAGEGSVDKVVIVAHSGDDSKWVFNRLSDPTLVNVGSHIIVTTDAGVLTYVVKIIDHQTRFETGSSSYIMESHPDDLMLISCFTADLHNQNRIVVATLMR